MGGCRETGRRGGHIGPPVSWNFPVSGRRAAEGGGPYKVRLDKATAEKLDECIEELNVSKAEVIRRGVHKVHDDLKTK